jgi:hypothetical protein
MPELADPAGIATRRAKPYALRVIS